MPRWDRERSSYFMVAPEAPIQLAPDAPILLLPGLNYKGPGHRKTSTPSAPSGAQHLLRRLGEGL